MARDVQWRGAMPKKHCKKEPRYVSILTVRCGTISSLIDMMRYDRCCPASEEESSKMERLVGHRAEPRDHVVRLIRYAATDQPATEDRWRSFGCVVLDERSPDAPPLTEAEALNLAKIKAGA